MDPVPIGVLRGHGAAVNCFDVADPPEGPSLLVSGAADGAVKLWDLAVRRAVATAAPHGAASVLAAAFAADDAVLTHGRDGAVRLLRLADLGRPVGEWPCSSYNFCKARVERAAQLLAIPTEDATVSVFDLRGPPVQAIGVPPVSAGMVMDHAFLGAAAGAPGQRLVAAYESGHVALWDLRQPAAPVFTEHLHTEPVMRVVPSDDEALLCTCSADKSVKVWSWSASGTAARWAQSHSEGVADAGFRCDGRLLVAGGWDHRLHVYDLAKRGRKLAVLKYHGASVTAVRFAADGRIFASGADGLLTVWDVFPLRKAPAPAE